MVPIAFLLIIHKLGKVNKENVRLLARNAVLTTQVNAIGKLSLPIEQYLRMDNPEEWITRRRDICMLLGLSPEKLALIIADKDSGFPDAFIKGPGTRVWLRSQIVEWKATNQYFGESK